MKQKIIAKGPFDEEDYKRIKGALEPKRILRLTLHGVFIIITVTGLTALSIWFSS